jgi:hypothetical protein
MDLNQGYQVSRISIKSLTPELWIFISCYFDSLKSFIQIWIILKLYRNEISTTHSSYWFNLLKEFLESRSLTMEQMNHVSHLISYYRKEQDSSKSNQPSAVPTVLHGEDYFHFIQILFQRSRCNR